MRSETGRRSGSGRRHGGPRRGGTPDRARNVREILDTVKTLAAERPGDGLAGAIGETLSGPELQTLLQVMGAGTREAGAP